MHERDTAMRPTRDAPKDLRLRPGPNTPAGSNGAATEKQGEGHNDSSPGAKTRGAKEKVREAKVEPQKPTASKTSVA